MPAFGKRNVGTRAAFAPAAATRPESRTAHAEDESFPRSAASTQRPSRVPYLSMAILGALALVYWAELSHGVDPARDLAPSHRTIIALGGLSGRMVGMGEWWRLFTGPLLHGNLMHLVSNGFALVLAG